MNRIIIATLSLLAISLFTGMAHASTATYANPTYQGDRLDWCRDWGIGCGKEAADAFCKTKGFTNATTYAIDPDIGAVSRTRVIGTGAVCDQGFCDGFKQVTCYKPAPVTKVYLQPMQGANRLDWCLNWGVGCGKPAADKFCQMHGFAQSLAIAEDPDIGAVTPTRLISTGAVCDQAFCDGFKAIKCGS